MERSGRKKRTDKVAGPSGLEVISLQKVNSLIVLVKRREAKKLCAKWRLQDYNFGKSGFELVLHY